MPGLGFAGSAARSGFSVHGPSTVGERRVHAPFSLMTDGTNTFMYVPAKSVTINGKAFAPTGLTAHDLTDWYVVTSFTTGLNLYVVFDDTDGQYGKPISVEFGTSAPSGRVITIPILAAATDGLVSIAIGAVYHERSSFDGDVACSLYKSIEKATGGGWTDEDHTEQVRGFRGATAPCGCLLDTADSYTHTLAVRESDGTCADMRWVTDADMAEAVGKWLVCNCSWVCDGGGEGDDFCLSTDFFCWYDSLCAGCGFWEQGADNSVNYGASIGCSGGGKVIDLDSRILVDSWGVDCTFSAYTLCTNDLTVGCNFIIAGCTVAVCTTGGYFCGFLYLV